MAVDRLEALDAVPRARLAALPTQLHPLRRLSERLDGPELWIKRDDLTGLAGGGNKTRKLEFLVADALGAAADTLLTVGAIQSNHTRQTAAAAARSGLGCVLLHNNWVPGAGDLYRRVGNVLLSDLLGAELLFDGVDRVVGDHGQLEAVAAVLRDRGRRPYVIPGGGSEHPLGGLGYAACAREIANQATQLEVTFDVIVHCTGSGSTQAGLLAGFEALDNPVRVIGVADDGETALKRELVLRLANATLALLGVPSRVAASRVEVVAADPNAYGVPSARLVDAIRLFAQAEGLIADPVYEGRTVLALLDLVKHEVLHRGQRVLMLHMGGAPGVHAYADRLAAGALVPLDRWPSVLDERIDRPDPPSVESVDVDPPDVARVPSHEPERSEDAR